MEVIIESKCKRKFLALRTRERELIAEQIVSNKHKEAAADFSTFDDLRY
jgi:hypothetical protein